MRVRIQHKTHYQYEEPATLWPQIVRLAPAPHTRAKVLSYALQIEPECVVHRQHDAWANDIARLTFAQGQTVETLTLTVDAAFELQALNPFDFFIDARCEELPFSYPDGLDKELAPFLVLPDPDPVLEAWVESVPFEGRTVDYLVTLNSRVAQDINYIIRNEAGVRTAKETLDLREGSCRDSAWLIVQALRLRGLAARFASGYLIQLTDEGIIPDLPRGMDHDVVDLHAWAEVYVPGAGWIGLDGTSGLLCGEGHIPLATATLPELAAPISGMVSHSATLSFEMEVERLGHEPRPRKPYTDESWEELVAAGDVVDQRLVDHGLKLTVGGEPTYTSRLSPHEPEWLTEALGPTKWTQGLAMAEELRQRIADGALAIHRFGKHYPGESLPRWALQLLWREDGVPLWSDPPLLALVPPEDAVAVAETRDAARLAEAMCEHLELPKEAIIDGYEDPWVAIMEEARLPEDVDPTKADLDDPEERRRLARHLDRGLGSPIGYVMPIQWQQAQWVTERWRLRRERLYLVPGDSPMGLRLPLGSVSARSATQWTVDPFAPREPLPADPRQRRRRANVPKSEGGSAWLRAGGAGGSDIEGTIRTAMCFEERDGVVHVFVPPVPTPEAFVELIGAIEVAATAIGLPVRIEGYPPPRDARINSCLVTPDPGVIEVNIPVCHTFREYVETLEMVGDAANHAGLCTEKFQLDGREAGSGGGNHITLGGPTPAESPFLQDPRLLAGMLRYVQRHPSLSYLFTGFVGPTSQAPRIDEARMDAVYELELALNRVQSGCDPVQPWYVDRLLRNLLVDVTGNTHRTEICIDKLYDPLSPTGRLGILEFRAFEMPPNERMACAQVHLLRTLVARMAVSPYREPLIRFGRNLHDRYLLPHFLWEDVLDIRKDVRSYDLPLDPEWYRPFLDFRCPVVGSTRIGELELELRCALEPWLVLGEEPTGATVSRYVDSSLERVQLRVRGPLEDRFAVTVNGVRIPLYATSRGDEYIAGIRFRAWQPPHCLHPHIGIHHPLQFDVVDLWGKRSLGSCTYHVWHPEGRAYDEPPLTAFDAAARRAQRFTTDGHLSYPVVPPLVSPHPENPVTMDLRLLALDRPMPEEVELNDYHTRE